MDLLPCSPRFPVPALRRSWWELGCTRWIMPHPWCFCCMVLWRAPEGGTERGGVLSCSVESMKHLCATDLSLPLRVVSSVTSAISFSANLGRKRSASINITILAKDFVMVGFLQVCIHFPGKTRLSQFYISLIIKSYYLSWLRLFLMVKI